MPDSSFQELIRRVRSGDGAAADELVRLYEPHVRRAARIRMNQSHLRRLLDSMDISQSVFGRFFAGAASGKFRIESPAELVALLVTMTENRLHDWHRRQCAQRRDHRREVSIDLLAEGFPSADASGPHDLGTNSETQESLERLMAQLPAFERRLAQCRISGSSWAKISQREGKSPDALRMQLRRATDLVLRELERDR